MDGIVAYALSKGYTEERISSLGDITRIKGTKPTVADLPTTGNKVGDIWIVTANNSEHVWTTQNQWEQLGTHSGTFKPMKSSWTGSNLTTAQAAELILADADVLDGDAFAGGVDWSDLSTIGLGNGEATARVGGNKTFVLFTMSSSDTAPYEWNYNTFAGVWRAYSPESVLFTEQSLFDNEKAQARTNIGAVALAPYDSSATPVDGVLYYTVEP